MSKRYVVGMVGNPNCGKTTLFNALTGSRQRVGNWPGVTVERKVGRFTLGDLEIELIDLPGTYSLEVTDEAISVDERIARDFIAERQADLIINIVDAANLERNLYLTSQLLEMRIPMLLALNMVDVAEEAGIRVDAAEVSRSLGYPVASVAAASGRGLAEFKDLLAAALRNPPRSPVELAYAAPIEAAISELLVQLSNLKVPQQVDPRWLAIHLLEGDSLAQQLAPGGAANSVPALQQRIVEALADDIDISVADARYGFANKLVERAVKRQGRVSRNHSERIDRVALNRFLGIPIFLALMYLMFTFTINLGGALIDAFDLVVGAVAVEGFGALLAGLGAPEWLVVLLADGAGGGVQTVATFIPIIASLFLFLSILEDSGYMARAAFVMDRFMRSIGLPGKAFVPMLVGFGCTVPAVMATRTLEEERERKLTIVMAPFMSCGARLPVYVLFAAAFFTAWGQNLVFALYLLGVVAAVITGAILKRTLFQGRVTPFVMELPPYRLPTLRGVLIHTWERTRAFVLSAGRVIIPLVLLLNVLNSVGSDGSFGNEDSDRSLLSAVGRAITPVFSPIGVSQENWPASVGIFTGFLAKEALVGTLDALYSGLAADEAASLVVPQPLSWLSEQEAAGVSAGTFGAMAARFDGRAGAFAYLLFVLLYIPCVAAMAAVRRETSPRFALFVALWTTGFAYVAATLFYQVATIAQHPATSIAWIVGLLLFVTVVIALLRSAGSRERKPLATPASVRV